MRFYRLNLLITIGLFVCSVTISAAARAQGLQPYKVKDLQWVKCAVSSLSQTESHAEPVEKSAGYF